MRASRSGLKHHGFYLQALSFLLFLLVFYNSAPALSVTVIVESAEAIGGRTPAEVGEAVLSSALKSAVEKAAQMIDPALGSKFLERVGKDDHLTYISSYKIINESFVGNEYKIALEADVDSLKLKNEIKSIIGGEAGYSLKPSISVVVLTNPDSDSALGLIPLSDIKREISVIFIGSGYRVVEKGGDIVLEAYLGLKTTGDETFGSSEYYAFGSVNLKARYSRDAAAIAEARDSSYLSGAAIEEAGLKALKQAALGAASRLKSELDGELRPSDGYIKISFRGVTTYRQYQKLDEMLSESVFAVERIAKRIFKDGEVAFLVLSKEAPEDLAKALVNLSHSAFSLKLFDVRRNGIEFGLIARSRAQ